MCLLCHKASSKLESPCVVPSFDTTSIPLRTNCRDSAFYKFLTNFEIDGQRYDILCKIDCLFKKLIVLIPSASKIWSVFSSLCTSFTEWIAAWIPASYPTQIFTDIGVFITCSFNRETITLPVIRFKTSPAAIGSSLAYSSAFYQQIELKTVMTLPKEKAIYTLDKLLTDDK